MQDTENAVELALGSNTQSTSEDARSHVAEGSVCKGYRNHIQRILRGSYNGRGSSAYSGVVSVEGPKTLSTKESSTLKLPLDPTQAGDAYCMEYLTS
jgi:hypothetical protein